MAAKKTGLGRGLDSLMNSSTPPPKSPEHDAGVTEIDITRITANPFQPRERFEEEALEELTDSIRELGVLSPLLVRMRGGEGTGYQLIAGERRFRAAQRAGLKTVPALVKDLSDQEALEIALVENLQRKDLNVIEEAEGYQRLAEEFGLTQEAIAKRVGKGRATVANALRLLTLAAPVRERVSDGRLSAGHAKALLGLDLAEEQELLAEEAVRGRWSVRETERQVRKRLHPPSSKPRATGTSDLPADHVRHLTEQLHRRLGTKVRLHPTETLAGGKTKPGKLEVEFFSNDDLDRLLEILGLTDDL